MKLYTNSNKPIVLDSKNFALVNPATGKEVTMGCGKGKGKKDRKGKGK